MVLILELTGNVTVANSDATVRGKGTKFTTELKVDDSISFTNDAGATVTGIVRNIISQTELTLTANVGGSDVTTGGIPTRRRAKLQNPEQNISIFKLPNTTVSTLKTAANGGQQILTLMLEDNLYKHYHQMVMKLLLLVQMKLCSHADDDLHVTIMTLVLVEQVLLVMFKYFR